MTTTTTTAPAPRTGLAAAEPLPSLAACRDAAARRRNRAAVTAAVAAEVAKLEEAGANLAAAPLRAWLARQPREGER